MSIPGAASPLFIGAAAEAGPFQISRSLRFNDDDSAHLSKSFSSAGNRKKWTWSGWVKRSNLSSANSDVKSIFAAYTDSSNRDVLRFTDDNGTDIITFQVTTSGTSKTEYTSAVFRDVSAWMHVVLAFDSAQSTASDRVKIYVNGALQTLSGTAVAQDTQSSINSNVAHYLGARSSSGSAELFYDGYLANVQFIDGQALAPTDFGETDDNNNWNPKEYSGSYGTNGFHLDFSNTSDLGADAAGSNDWTPNNLFGTAPGLSTANQGFDVRSGLSAQFTINDLNFQPDLIVAKSTSNSEYWIWVDSVRGFDKVLKSNTTDAENSSGAAVTSVGSSGFTSSNNWFTTGRTYVTWCWKAGGTASSNSDGTITSSVSANTTYGFSVVSYSGNGTAGATVGHGLGQVPKWIVIKSRNRTDNWRVYHSGIGETKSLFLSTQGAADDNSTYWNDTAPTSSVFSLGTDTGVNTSSDPVIAYCWSEISGFSKFGSYTGNGSTTGPIVTTGFKPRFLLIKADIAGEDWVIMDTARDSGNPVDQAFFANAADAEITNSAYNTEFQVDGFQLKNTNPRFNTSGETYIYAAFASKPDESVIDSLIDTPTNYTAGSGNNGGNYPTLNPLKKASITTSNGNLDFAHSGSTGFWQVVFSTMGMTSGKYYCEFTCADADSIIGIAKDSHTLANDKYLGQDPNGWSYNGQNGQKINNSSGSSYGNTFTSGDIIGIAFDATGGNLYFYKNGTAQNSGTAAFTGLTDGPYLFAFSIRDTGSTHNVNFGQRPFSQSVPTGYTSLVTTNLPDPTIADGSTVMQTKLWTGDGSSTRAISGYNHSPDFVWIKNRSLTGWQHVLYDQIRGGGTGSVTKSLSTDSTRSEASGNDTNHGYLSGFTSDGFSLVKGSQSGGDYVNHSGNAYVGWSWDAGTSTATNNDGSIASSVRVNQSAGFSIATYTGTGSNATVGHGLNAAPYWVVVKRRDSAGSWIVWHNAFGAASNTDYLYLNSTIGKGGDGSNAFWNSTVPTNSVFSVATGGSVNASGATYVAYCWAPVAGYSSFGQYTGNGSSDGTFVYTGFRVAWLMTKRTDTSENWEVRDSTRNPHNRTNLTLFPHTAGAEDAGSVDFDLLSNGFKLRNTNGSTNANGGTYVYFAFAENPFSTARAR